jgi:large subunit ribosomal protein L24
MAFGSKISKHGVLNMKKEFSISWKSSKQPRKQRKYAAKAPLHIKNRFLSVMLSKDLRKKYSQRNLRVRKDDSVKIMRGKFKKKTGKILGVDVKKTRVYIDGIQQKKKDGSKVNIPFHPSKLQIIELGKTEKERFKKPKIWAEKAKEELKQ